MRPLRVQASGRATQQACSRRGEGKIVYCVPLYEEYLPLLLPHTASVGR